MSGTFLGRLFLSAITQSLGYILFSGSKCCYYYYYDQNVLLRSVLADVVVWRWIARDNNDRQSNRQTQRETQREREREWERDVDRRVWGVRVCECVCVCARTWPAEQSDMFWVSRRSRHIPASRQLTPQYHAYKHSHTFTFIYIQTT